MNMLNLNCVCLQGDHGLPGPAGPQVRIKIGAFSPRSADDTIRNSVVLLFPTGASRTPRTQRRIWLTWTECEHVFSS